MRVGVHLRALKTSLQARNNIVNKSSCHSAELSPAAAAVCQAFKGKNEMIFQGHPDLSLINEIVKYLCFSYHSTWERVVGQNKQKGK